MLLNPAYVDSDEAESDFYNLENMIVEYQQSPQGLTLDKSKINKELVEVIVENFNTTDLKKLCVASITQTGIFRTLLIASWCKKQILKTYYQH